MDPWSLGPGDGSLEVRTGVDGRAARMGHRLTLLMAEWSATVEFAGDTPGAVVIEVPVAGLTVLRGEGGVKGLSEPEKLLARSNALRALDADDHPTIRFECDAPEQVEGGFRLPGRLQIHGVTHGVTAELQVMQVEGQWNLSADVPLRQSDYGVTPYSLMMGALRVADEVEVTFRATRAAA